MICFVLILNSSAVLLLNSTSGNTDSYAQEAMVSSSYVRYWIFIVGRKRSSRPCYGWTTWHTWDPRRKRRTGDSIHLLVPCIFSPYCTSVFTKCVSLCFCIRVRLALMDLKETEDNQAWRSEQIDVYDSWFIVMPSCIFYSATHWILKISSNDTKTIFALKGGWDSGLCSKRDEPALWWVDNRFLSPSATIFHHHQWLFHILKTGNQNKSSTATFIFVRKIILTNCHYFGIVLNYCPPHEWQTRFMVWLQCRMEQNEIWDEINLCLLFSPLYILFFHLGIHFTEVCWLMLILIYLVSIKLSLFLSFSLSLWR